MDKKRIILRKDFFPIIDGEEHTKEREYNWLWATETHEITTTNLEALQSGNCLTLNVNNEFVCYVILRKEDNEN